VDADQISATYHNGVLTVSIPVAEKAKPRRIQVSAPADQTVIEGSPQHSEAAGGEAS
jgi:HSP20 family protein